MKNRLVTLTLLSIAGLGSSVGQPPVRPEFSLSIRTASEAASGHRVELHITKTNLSGHAMMVGANRIAPYTFDVWCNGVLVPETEQARNLREHPVPGAMIDGNLPPRGWALDTVAVNEYRDMRQPCVYTVQVREGSVKSNTVTVTVTP